MVEEEEGKRPQVLASGFHRLRKRKKEGRERMSNGYGGEDEVPAIAVLIGKKKSHGWLCSALFGSVRAFDLLGKGEGTREKKKGCGGGNDPKNLFVISRLLFTIVTLRSSIHRDGCEIRFQKF